MRKFRKDSPVDPRFLAMASGLAPQLTIGTSGDARQDANETAFFARQLEYIYAQTYDVLYPEYKARSLFPVDSSVPPGAETHTYRLYDKVGMAKMIANYADDLPNVSLFGTETTGKLRSLGDSYSYSLQDIRRAQMAGMPLEANMAMAARRAIEAKIDDLAAFGQSDIGLVGALNHPNIPTVSGLNGDWGNNSTTADEILEDMNAVANAIVSTTKGVHRPNTLILPISSYLIAAQKRMSSQSDTTVLEFFLKTNPYVTNVEQWYKLETADEGLDGPRIMAYQRSPEVISLVVSQEFEQMPPQAKNLSFLVPCHARFGGVKVVYPLAAAYGDIQ